jgi:hypothetical protein
MDPIPVDFAEAPAPPAATATRTPAQMPAQPKPGGTKPLSRPFPAQPAAKAPSGRREVAAEAPPPATKAVRRSTRMQSRQKPLGEILIAAQAVSTEQLSRALKIQEKGGKGLVGQILVQMGACDIVAVAQALGRQFRISTVELEHVEIPPETAAMVPEAMCREQRLIPFERLGKLLCVAMANCLNRKAINDIEELTKHKVKPFNCSWVEIRDAVERLYSQDTTRQAAAAAQQGAAGTATPDSTAAAAQAEAMARQIEQEISAKLTEEPAEPAPAAAGDSEELRPFTGQAKAVIEGMDSLDSEAEVVQTTERGLASRHLAARQARREERAKVMGTGKGVVGKLIAPDLDKFLPEQVSPQGPEVIDLRLVDAAEVAGAELPVATELFASVAEFAERLAPPVAPEPPPAPSAEPPAPEPAPAGAAEAERIAAEAAEAELPFIEDLELTPARGGGEHAAAPQTDTVAAAGALADELPAVPAIDHAPPRPRDLLPIPVSQEEWTRIEAEMEPDPVCAWEATYASAGPVSARTSLT